MGVTFESLPLEVQNMIFEHALDMDPPSSWPDEFEDPILRWGYVARRDSDEKIILGGLFISKALYNRAVDVFMRFNSFTFREARYLHDFIKKLSCLYAGPFNPIVGEVTLLINAFRPEAQAHRDLHAVLGSRTPGNGLSDLIPRLRHLVVEFEVWAFWFDGRRLTIHADASCRDEEGFRATVEVLRRCVRVSSVEVRGFQDLGFADWLEEEIRRPVDKAAYEDFMIRHQEMLAEEQRQRWGTESCSSDEMEMPESRAQATTAPELEVEAAVLKE